MKICCGLAGTVPSIIYFSSKGSYLTSYFLQCPEKNPYSLQLVRNFKHLDTTTLYRICNHTIAFLLYAPCLGRAH